MIVDREITIDAPADEVFTRVVDIPFVGSCLPGARDVTADPEDSDNYRGHFGVKVGPIAVGLQGNVRITESDPGARRAVLMLRGSDRRIGGQVVGEMTLGVTEKGETRSELVVHTDVTVSGKLGQFGQAVMIKKADQITEQFVAEFSRKLLAREEVVAATAAVAPAAALPAGAPSIAAVAPAGRPRTGDPYALTGLLGGGRRFRLDRGDLGTTTAPVWQLAGGGSEVRGRRVVEVTVADEAELGTALDAVTDPAALIAVSPRGEAVGDHGALAGLLKAATAAGRVALPVARTPWAALGVARVAAAESAPGLAVVLDVTTETSTLLQLAVAEVRAAGLHLPIVVGVVSDDGTAGELLAAGADAVILSRARRRTRVAAVVDRFRWKK